MTARKKTTRRKGAEAEAPAGAELPSFEEALRRLEELVERLEEGEVSLEESLEAYAEGVRLIRHCSGRLEAAEALIRELNEGEDGLRLGPSTLDAGEGDEDEEDAGW